MCHWRVGEEYSANKTCFGGQLTLKKKRQYKASPNMKADIHSDVSRGEKKVLLSLYTVRNSMLIGVLLEL